MPLDKFGYNSGENMSANQNLNQEQTAAENLLYQRLFIFLIIFSVLVIGAVNTQRKILFLSILFIGVIICWALTFILIRTAKRIDNKSGGRLVRLILGYLVPIFCSGILTIALFMGSFGFIDPYLFNLDVKSAQVESKIDELKNDIVKRISPETKKTSKNFKNVDSVIADSKTIRSGKPLTNISFENPSAQTEAAKQNTDSKYYKPIESVITESKTSRSSISPEGINAERSPEKIIVTPQKSSSKYFKAIDSVIVNEKPPSKKPLSKNPLNPLPSQVPKSSKSSKIFKNIDSVISKEK